LYTAYTFFEKYVLHKVLKFYFEFDCNDCFSTNFCFPKRKLVQFLLPQPKKHSGAYA